MRPFRFLHTADLHLGTPFRGIGGNVPHHWLQILRKASFEVFSRIVDIAISEKVDFVTLAGDLFDADDVPMASQFELLRGFERLSDHGISVFACHGNHDPLVQPSPIQWPDSVYIFSPVPATVPDDYQVPSTLLELEDETRVQISSFSYSNRELYRSMAECFQRDATADFAIGLYHGVVGSAAGHANYAATSLERLKARGFDFWGLGHIHQPTLIQDGRPVVVYPGNPQGRHIRESGPRGVCIVDVDAHGDIQLRTVNTAVVEWRHAEINVDGCESLDAVRSSVLDALKGMHSVAGRPVAEQTTGRHASDGSPRNDVLESERAFVVRITLMGQTAMHGSLQDSDGLLASIQDDLSYQRWPIWIELLQVQTQPLVDVDALEHSDAFIGEFVRLVKELRATPESAREMLAPILREVYHARNTLSLETITDEELASILDDVMRLVLAELTVEGSPS